MTTKRERQKANRAARRAREEKEARRRQRFKFWRRASIVIGIVVITGVGLSILNRDSPSPPTTTADTTTTQAITTTTMVTEPMVGPADYEGFRAQPTACGADAPAAPAELSFNAPEDQGIGLDTPITATIATSCGDIVVELDPSHSPQSVNSFIFLARQGYFDGTASHRVVPGFVIQLGDPTATGFGDPGFSIPDEFPEADFAYNRGVVAMAKASAPDTTGSQFFIVLGDTGLPPTFNVLGRVVSGIEVADVIATIPTAPPPGGGEPSRPLQTIYIERVVVEAG